MNAFTALCAVTKKVCHLAHLKANAQKTMSAKKDAWTAPCATWMKTHALKFVVKVNATWSALAASMKMMKLTAQNTVKPCAQLVPTATIWKKVQKLQLKQDHKD